ncbi:MAG TPA: S9 family peptidase, partial [Acidobacteriota bacterium]|nr:S9 family peptidase [Acidobacteriota bacterium]
MAPIVSPYGSWKSPITSDLAGGSEVGLEQVRNDVDDIYWVERRPQEGGRKVIVRRSSEGNVTDITPAGFNARTRVHEYGGGDYTVFNGSIIFSNFSDQRLYLQKKGAEPKPLTPPAALRYADGQIDKRRNIFFCVREDHTGADGAANTIVRVDLNGGDAGTIIAAGNDFYSSPRLSPDGSHLAWLTWNHPKMPWDGTEMWMGKLSDDGSVTEKEKIAGGIDESIFQPEWSPDGVLYFASDRTGWWNLYRWIKNRIEPLCPMNAEFGQPQWVFGGSLYGFASAQQIVCSYSKKGHDYLAKLDTTTKQIVSLEIPFTAISQVRPASNRVVFIGASVSESSSVVSLNLATGQLQRLRSSRQTIVDAGYLSEAVAIEYPTEGGLTAHGYFY